MEIEKVAKELADAIPRSLGGVYGGIVSRDTRGTEMITAILVKFAESIKKEAEDAVWEKLRNYGPPPRY